ncbi:MAG: hypothetical protein LQ337_007853 [Flavoplaca oasis]|nr:MAG: hypothetical protein LQ337_007853 [Flavoplaca oasis]
MIVHPSSNDGTVICTLETANLSTEPQYSALSYTWGPPTQQAQQRGMTSKRIHPISVNGTPCLVTENLFHFLRFAASNSKPGPWWIDAICINQDDILERNQQVLRMTDVYASASRVVVWLGEEEEYTNLAVRIIKAFGSIRLQDLFRIDPLRPSVGTVVLANETVGLSIDKYGCEALFWFYRRSWFTRIWVLQERALARQLAFQCGSQAVAREDLLNVAIYLSNSNWTHVRFGRPMDPDSALVSVPIISGIKNALAVLVFRLQKNADCGSQLLTAILLSRHCRSSNPRDKVYGLLGLLDSARETKPFNTILPDYRRTIPEVYLQATKLLLESAEDLLILSTVVDRTHKEVDDLPSWVPDYSVTSTTGIWCATERGYRPAKGLQAYWHVGDASSSLSLCASRLDTISEVGESKHELMHERRGEKLLSIVANMKDAYVPGQSKIEALWRTLIVDFWVEENSMDGYIWGKFEFPAPELVEEQFGEWLAWTAAQWLHQEQRCTKPRHPSKTSQETIVLWDRLCKSDDGALLRPVEDILELAEHTNWLDTDIYELELNRSYQVLFDHTPHARFFTTRIGYMGMGPLSLQDGDSVWLVPGSQTLFVLRDKPGLKRYEFVGDCYVHGVMNGEAAEAAIPDLETIELE